MTPNVRLARPLSQVPKVARRHSRSGRRRLARKTTRRPLSVLLLPLSVPVPVQVQNKKRELTQDSQTSCRRLEHGNAMCACCKTRPTYPYVEPARRLSQARVRVQVRSLRQLRAGSPSELQAETRSRVRAVGSASALATLLLHRTQRLLPAVRRDSRSPLVNRKKALEALGLETSRRRRIRQEEVFRSGLRRRRRARRGSRFRSEELLRRDKTMRLVLHLHRKRRWRRLQKSLRRQMRRRQRKL
mmetsp:Transcript_9592/g.17516  ORF Transcript_9592/g.17516 Transcript_9592/m.17516 type:complete len:244 (+) Transcript_9592:1446-2177(+)